MYVLSPLIFQSYDATLKFILLIKECFKFGTLYIIKIAHRVYVFKKIRTVRLRSPKMLKYFTNYDEPQDCLTNTYFAIDNEGYKRVQFT